MNDWITEKFGTQQRLDQALGLPKKTINRWLNSDPRHLLRHLPELVKLSGASHEEIVDLILDKQKQNT